MAVMDVMTTVSKETYEMGEALVLILKAVKKAQEDGWQAGQDLPVIITTVVANLGEVMDGVKAAKGEWVESKEAMIMAVAMTVAAAIEELS